MKISKKEKNLLIILLLAVIGYLFYTFVYTNQVMRLEEQKVERDTELMRYNQMQQIMASEGNIDLETEQIKAELLPVARRYFGAVDQEETIMVLNDFANVSQIDVTKIAFTEIVDKSIEEFNEGEETAAEPAPENAEPAPENAELSGEQPPDVETLENIKHMSAQVSFEGTYENLMSFLNEMGNYNKNIVSTTLNIKESDTAPIEGDVLLDFYIVKEVDKYIGKSASVFEYNYTPKTAKKSPFESYAWAYSVTDVPVRAYVSDIPASGSFSSDFSIARNDQDFKAENDTSGFADPSHTNKENYVAKAETTASDAALPGSIMRLDTVPVIFSKNLEEPGVTLLADFENQKDIRTFTLDDRNDMYGDLYTNAVSGLKSYRIKYSLGSDSEVYVYLRDKNIIIDKKPEYIRMNVYSYQKSDDVMGIVFTDAKGLDYKMFLNKKVDWLEWKELRGHIPPEASYPVTVKSIFVRSETSVKDGQLLFDALGMKN